MKQTKPTMYNLVYIVNGVIKETLESNKPLGICKYQMHLKWDTGRYNKGLLQCRKVK